MNGITSMQRSSTSYADYGKFASGKKVNREGFPPFGSATAAKISRHVSYEEPCRVPGSRHSKYPLSV